MNHYIFQKETVNLCFFYKKKKDQQSITREKKWHEHCTIFMTQSPLHCIAGYKACTHCEVRMPFFIHHNAFQNLYVSYQALSAQPSLYMPVFKIQCFPFGVWDEWSFQRVNLSPFYKFEPLCTSTCWHVHRTQCPLSLISYDSTSSAFCPLFFSFIRLNVLCFQFHRTQHPPFLISQDSTSSIFQFHRTQCPPFFSFI